MPSGEDFTPADVLRVAGLRGNLRCVVCHYGFLRPRSRVELHDCGVGPIPRTSEHSAQEIPDVENSPLNASATLSARMRARFRNAKIAGAATSVHRKEMQPMARLDDLHPDLAKLLREYEYPEIGISAWRTGPPVARRRVALVSSAGLRRRDDRPFGASSVDYRVVPFEKRNQVVQDHISASHDRTGFQQDLNVVFPLDRLAELDEVGAIGSVASYHYSFMGATDPVQMEPAARQLAGTLRADAVDAAVFCPV